MCSGLSSVCKAYLIVVHLELADDFDGDLLVCLGISCSVYVAEGAIAHLLDEDESFQTRILRHLAGLCSFLGDDSGNVGMSVSVLDFLVSSLSLRCSVASLSSDVAVVAGADRELSRVILASLIVLLFCMAKLRFAHTVTIFLLLSMHRRDIGGGLVSRWVNIFGLLTMT